MADDQQVNAWASYEQTGKNARKFSSRDGVRAEQRVPLNLTPLNLSRHSVQSLLSRSITSQQGQVQAALSRSIKSNDGGAMGRIGASPTSMEAQMKGPGYFERLSSTRGVSTQSLVSEQFQSGKLTGFIRSDIMDVFAVFFEAAHTGDQSSPQMEDVVFSLSYFASFFNATMPWTHRYYQSSIVIFIEICLRGISQVYFQNNPMSGLLILIGMFLQSTRIAVHGIIAVVFGTFAAFLLGFDQGLAMSGLFGFNSFLVGLALATFDSRSTGDTGSDYHASTIFATVVFSMFSSILFVMMGKLLVPYKSPPLTLPFNVATLIFLLGMANMGRVSIDSVRISALPSYGEMDDIAAVTAREFCGGIIRGIGQVYLADSLVSGILVLAGIAVCSRIAAVAAVVGSALGAVGAVLTGVPGSVIESGMYGFNSSLTVTAIFFFYAPSIGAGVLGVFASMMTVACQQALATLLLPWGLPFMTLPFCVGTLPFVILQGTTSIVIAIPLATTTIPEDHYRRVSMLTDGTSFIFDSIRRGVENTEDHHDGSHHSGEDATTRSPNQTLKRKISRSMSKSLCVLSEAIEMDNKDHTDTEDDQNVATTTCCRRFLDKNGGRGMHATEDMSLRKAAYRIYNALDDAKTGHVQLVEVTSALKACGFIDTEGLHFAALILTLLDVDKSNTIEKSDFLAFATIARAIRDIRRKISHFVIFVDENGNGLVDFHEIDMALDYLGQPTLSDEDKERLVRETRLGDEDVDLEIETYEIDIVELINFVTASKVEELWKNTTDKRSPSRLKRGVHPNSDTNSTKEEIYA